MWKRCVKGVEVQSAEAVLTGNEGLEPCLEVNLLRLVALNVLKQVLDFAADVKMRVVGRVIHAAAAFLALAFIAALLLLFVLLLLIIELATYKTE
jgi:hypothetical protein